MTVNLEEIVWGDSLKLSIYALVFLDLYIQLMNMEKLALGIQAVLFILSIWRSSHADIFLFSLLNIELQFFPESFYFLCHLRIRIPQTDHNVHVHEL